jgi:hypothetical protein
MANATTGKGMYGACRGYTDFLKQKDTKNTERGTAERRIFSVALVQVTQSSTEKTQRATENALFFVCSVSPCFKNLVSTARRVTTRPVYTTRGLKARKSLAQGNALWNNDACSLSPERATSLLISPFQGGDMAVTWLPLPSLSIVNYPLSIDL